MDEEPVVQTFVTCAVLETPEPCAWEAGLALGLDVPEGTAVREDPDVPGIFYLESCVVTADTGSALELAARAAQAVVGGLGFPAVVDEVLVVGPDGATRWSAVDVDVSDAASA